MGKRQFKPGNMLYPVPAVMVSVAILGETMTFWQGIGGLLILGFTLWNEISPKTGNK